MSRARWLALAAAAVSGAACGGSPAGPDPVPTAAVAVRVFFDENGDGVLSGSERGRIPGVDVLLGGRSGTSDGAGLAMVAGVPQGSQPLGVRLESLPPFFVPFTSPPVGVPASGELVLGLFLPINGPRLHVYMASGDSISEGFGSSGAGYRNRLAALLGGRWGVPASVPYAGPGGGNSSEALVRIDRDLAALRPAYTLLQWGVNDWLAPGCQPDPRECSVVANLQRLVERVQAAGSLPVLATLTPVNVGANDQAPASREEWVELLNQEIRTLASSSGALLVDVHAAFASAGPTRDLFVDHVHPNDAGYEVIANAYFQAITGPRN